MNKNFLFLFLFLISCNNQVENKSRLEVPDKIAYDTIVRNQLIKDANSEILNGDIAGFYKISSALEKQAVISSDTSGILYSRMNLGYYFSEIYQIDSAYFYLTSAEKLSKNTKSKELLEYLLQYKADILWSQKNYLEAQSYSIEALKILKIKKNPELEHTCYVTIANSLEGVNKNNEALKYYNKALEVVNTKNVAFANSHTSMLYFYISTIYEKQNNITKSIEYINKGLSNNNLKSENIRVYSYLKNTLGKSIYKTQKEKALSIYTENLKIGDSLNFAPLQVTSQLRLGEYYLFYKDTLKANTYLLKAKEIAHKNQIFDDELITLKLLSKSNPSKSNYYSERYIQLNDSLLAVERATRDKFARIEFETDEISTQKNQFEKENKKLNTRLLIAIGFALLLLLSLYLWFKNKSNKAKITELKLIQEKQELQNNELLFIQEQQRKDEKMYQLLLHQQDKIEEGKQTEKIRISRELHDGIMGKLSGIRLNLYILKKKTDPETIARCLEYIKEIQVIENDLRKLSHDLNKDTISSANGIENEINNLFNEIKNHQNIEFDLEIGQGIIWENIKYIAKLNLYRIIQEALHNIDKYAKAKIVVITIAQKEQSLLIQIKDDGIGFDSNQKKEGIGLKNMRERTEESGGTFSIETAPKKGTKINLQLPF
ncbi:ATP-binding protein [Flavobacterium sp. SM2513]|uniref:tetratricopeptide repeat-containing sensor histidine kinase n=1 Tax=Flavobacterium sp. SM2513 TaxID=3424766 RepID=UPI003D7F5627